MYVFANIRQDCLLIISFNKHQECDYLLLNTGYRPCLVYFFFVSLKLFFCSVSCNNSLCLFVILSLFFSSSQHLCRSFVTCWVEWRLSTEPNLNSLSRYNSSTSRSLGLRVRVTVRSLFNKLICPSEGQCKSISIRVSMSYSRLSNGT